MRNESTEVGQKRERRNIVATGEDSKTQEGYFWVGRDLMRRFLPQGAGWTEAWSSPCTTGVSGPEPLKRPSIRGRWAGCGRKWTPRDRWAGRRALASLWFSDWGMVST